MKIHTKLMLAGACAASLMGASAQAQLGSARATLYEFPNFQGRSVTIYRNNDNLADSNFNDLAQSGHFDGDWTVCSDANYRGNCQTLSGDVGNLNQYSLGRTVSSLRQGADPYADNAGRGGPRYQDDTGYGDQGHGYATPPADNGRGYVDPNTGGQGYGDSGRGYGDTDRGYGDTGRGYGDTGRGGYGRQDDGVQGRSVVFFARPKASGQDIAAYDRTAADWFCRSQGLGSSVYFDISERGRGMRWQGGGLSVTGPVLRDAVCRKR
jgi:hypothetical protein